MQVFNNLSLSLSLPSSLPLSLSLSPLFSLSHHLKVNLGDTIRIKCVPRSFDNVVYLVSEITIELIKREGGREREEKEGKGGREGEREEREKKGGGNLHN